MEQHEEKLSDKIQSAIERIKEKPQPKFIKKTSVDPESFEHDGWKVTVIQNNGKYEVDLRKQFRTNWTKPLFNFINKSKEDENKDLEVRFWYKKHMFDFSESMSEFKMNNESITIETSCNKTLLKSVEKQIKIPEKVSKDIDEYSELINYFGKFPFEKEAVETTKNGENYTLSFKVKSDRLRGFDPRYTLRLNSAEGFDVTKLDMRYFNRATIEDDLGMIEFSNEYSELTKINAKFYSPIKPEKVQEIESIK